MKIGIIGSGIVGQVLAKAFIQEGHDIMLGTRDVSKEEVVKFKEHNPDANIGTFTATAKFGEVIVLATGGAVTLNAIDLAGKENFAGKVVIDTTNPIAAEPPVNGVLRYFTNINFSLMESLQQALPNARLVKAFNSVGNAFMYKPQFELTPTMFICGNDGEAKKTVTGILSSFGWETEDMGKVEAARAIEPLCILWCAPGFQRNQWRHAFKLLKK
jgi:8-hydroxy-5-deazaflavin:NADPH oxidoreductase